MQCFKKIYLKILSILPIFLIIENVNASTNACTVQRTNASIPFRRPPVSIPTSNGPRLLSDALDTRVDNMLIYVALDPMDSPEHPLQQPILEACVRRCDRTSLASSINETYYGYRTFTDLIKDAQTRGLIDLEYDKDRGNYKIGVKEG